MTPQTNLGRILALLAVTIAVTIVDSYLPHTLTLTRQILSFVQLGLMGVIAAITVRAVLEDF